MPWFIQVPWLPGSRKGVSLILVVLYVGTLRPSDQIHETIHFRQWMELLIVGFLVVYVADWLYGARITGDWRIMGEAYRRIRLEREAYTYEGDPRYLATRKPYAWRSLRVAAD